MPKESRKCLPGPPTPGPQEVSKKSRGQCEVSGESPESVWRVFLEFLGTFGDFLGSWGRRPGRHFRDSFGISGPEGPRETSSVRGGLVQGSSPSQISAPDVGKFCTGSVQTGSERNSHFCSKLPLFALVLYLAEAEKSEEKGENAEKRGKTRKKEGKIA